LLASFLGLSFRALLCALWGFEMNLQKVIAADSAMQRIDARLSSLFESELRADFQRAAWIISEVRHYAVCMDDARGMPAGFRRDDFVRECEARLLRAFIVDPVT
jgi:hypothetical protein